jgi:hypothetical protein
MRGHVYHTQRKLGLCPKYRSSPSSHVLVIERSITVRPCCSAMRDYGGWLSDQPAMGDSAGAGQLRLYYEPLGE